MQINSMYCTKSEGAIWSSRCRNWTPPQELGFPAWSVHSSHHAPLGVPPDDGDARADVWAFISVFGTQHVPFQSLQHSLQVGVCPHDDLRQAWSGVNCVFCRRVLDEVYVFDVGQWKCLWFYVAVRQEDDGEECREDGQLHSADGLWF